MVDYDTNGALWRIKLNQKLVVNLLAEVKCGEELVKKGEGLLIIFL